MGSDEQERLSEEMAARLWQRATELQSEAARRAEKTSLLASEAEVSGPDTDGYALDHVRQAAEDAGISGEYVDAALAEVSAQGAGGHDTNSVLDRVAKRLLGGRPPEFLDARRVLAATPDAVYETMQRMFPNPPYNLALRDIQGDVLDGGILIFDVSPVTALKYTSFEYEMSYPGIKQIMVSLHPVGEGSCEVVVRCPLQAGRRIAGGIFGGLTGVAGVGGLVGGLSLGVAIGTGLGLGALGLVPLVGGMALAGGGGLGGTSRFLFRKLYRYSLVRGTNAIDGLLSTLNVSVMSDWGGAGRPTIADRQAPSGFLPDTTT